MNFKICTDIKQSRHLIELGIDKNSNDMYIGNYVNVDTNRVDDTNVAYYTRGSSFGAPQIIPAWSLAALERLIPCGINTDKGTYLFDKWNRENGSWKCAYRMGESEYIGFSGDNFSIIFEMIVWLIENNYSLKYESK